MKWKELAIRDKSTACLYFVCIICTNAKRIKDIAMHCLNALALNCQKQEMLLLILKKNYKQDILVVLLTYNMNIAG